MVRSTRMRRDGRLMMLRRWGLWVVGLRNHGRHSRGRRNVRLRSRHIGLRRVGLRRVGLNRVRRMRVGLRYLGLLHLRVLHLRLLNVRLLHLGLLRVRVRRIGLMGQERMGRCRSLLRRIRIVSRIPDARLREWLRGWRVGLGGEPLGHRRYRGLLSKLWLWGRGRRRRVLHRGRVRLGNANVGFRRRRGVCNLLGLLSGPGRCLAYGFTPDFNRRRRGLVCLNGRKQRPALTRLLDFVLTHEFLIKLGARAQLLEQPGDVVGLSHQHPRKK